MKRIRKSGKRSCLARFLLLRLLPYLKRLSHTGCRFGSFTVRQHIVDKALIQSQLPAVIAISNSMTELYTNMRYLQYGTLQKLGLGHFDSWASFFGETQTAIELAPKGIGNHVLLVLTRL